jgi:hypothetical protein
MFEQTAYASCLHGHQMDEFYVRRACLYPLVDLVPMLHDVHVNESQAFHTASDPVSYPW